MERISLIIWGVCHSLLYRLLTAQGNQTMGLSRDQNPACDLLTKPSSPVWDHVHRRTEAPGVPMWLSGSRAWCHCCSLGCFCGMGSISDWGTSTCHRRGQKKKKIKLSHHLSPKKLQHNNASKCKMPSALQNGEIRSTIYLISAQPVVMLRGSVLIS